VKQVGWIDVKKEENYNPLYRPRLSSGERGPQCFHMSEAIEWIENLLNKRVVAVVVTDIVYRVCEEVVIETLSSTEVRNL